MAENRLNIIKLEKSEKNSIFNREASAPSRAARLRELQAKYERLWLIDPKRFDPLRNVIERERLERTWQLLIHHAPPNHQQVVDIGCGAGVFSCRLADNNYHVTAVDIAENALKYLRQKNQPNLSCQQEAMPSTSLPDHGYDIVICTEVVAEVYPEDYRLFFAELSRLIRPTGYLIFSSAIDIHTEQGVERLSELALTEFDILDDVLSYHALSIQLKNFFEIPSFYVKGWEDYSFYQEETQKRSGFSLLWFRLWASPVFVWIWYSLLPLTTLIVNHLKNSRSCLLWLEKGCRLFWHKRGISHYLFIAKQRPLQKMDPKEIPIEKPKRKEVWE